MLETQPCGCLSISWLHMSHYSLTHLVMSTGCFLSSEGMLPFPGELPGVDGHVVRLHSLHFSEKLQTALQYLPFYPGSQACVLVAPWAIAQH